MSRAPHAKHRYRIVSRCAACGVRLLGACTYRTCAVTTVYPIRHRDGCTAPWMPGPDAAARTQYWLGRKYGRPSRGMVAIARAIFGSDLIDTLPLED